jgi:hypothetical protein
MNSRFTPFWSGSTVFFSGRRAGRLAGFTTAAAVFASVAACGSGDGEQARNTSQAVLGNELDDTSCHTADVPQIQRAFQWARIAANSPALAQCIDLAYDSLEVVAPPNYGLMQIGNYNPCVGDPATSGPGTIMQNVLSPNPVDIKCDYTAEGTSEGGYANIGDVPLSNTTARETITLGSVLAGLAGTPSDDAYAIAGATIMHEIMHQKGYNHIQAYNPGNACAAGLTPSQLCGLPCSENPYYGNGIPYQVGECVRVVLEESMDHCAGMKRACGPNGLQLVESILDSSPTCSCVGDPSARSTVAVFRKPGATYNPSSGEDQWTLGNGTPGTRTTAFLFGGAGDLPIIGDWDGNGSKTPGVFRPAHSTWNSSSNNEWILSNDPSGATALPGFYFGVSGDLPIVGDWDGNGTTTVGLFRPAGAPLNPGTTDAWILTNDPKAKTVLPKFQYGAPGDLPVAGDWDGNGTTTVGVFRNAGAPFNPATTDMWILTNDPRGATALPSFQYGAPGDLPVVGDWDGNRTTTVGVFRNAGAPFNPGTTDMWILTNDPKGVTALPSFQYGAPGDLPVVAASTRE